MKILIIGSEGFIGKSLMRYLQLQQHDIWSADIQKKVDCPEYFQTTTPEAFDDIFQNNQFEVCINCAGSASVPFSISEPLVDFTLNVHLVANILNAILKWNHDCKFLQLSSAAVYGNPKVLPIQESEALSPVSPYGIHKMHAEQICQYFNKYFKLHTGVVRIFSAYGVGLKKQLFWDVFNRIESNSSLQFFGTGNETRDFINIDDVTRAIGFIADKGAFEGEIYNLAVGKQTTIRDAIQSFLEVMKCDRPITFSGENRMGDPLFWEADIRKISALGFSPQVSLNEGLKNYALWLKG
ncbi:MAG: SDR family oxidoreductase [Imperialibacter sp.]|uniref:NAD-dependent epimerase/dehydratase family protein n=1 Tax=Imperialibacter sp. TaxID=2038411 RepID=UPI0032EF4710